MNKGIFKQIWPGLLGVVALVMLLSLRVTNQPVEDPPTQKEDLKPDMVIAVPARKPGTAAQNTQQVQSATQAPLKPQLQNGPLLSVNRDPNHPYRLSNSIRPIGELFRSESAILLRNALIETTEPLNFLNIPDHLRSKEEPEVWVIQSSGKTTDRFRAILKSAGAEIISYIPRNAYLVKASTSVIAQLKQFPYVRATIPFEPYYKLDRELMPYAVDRQDLPLASAIRIALVPGTREKALQKIKQTGAQLIGESEFPYGPLLTVFPQPGSLVELAQMPEIQLLETHKAKVLLRDRARVRVGISTNANVAVDNLHGLTGSGVVVGVNGSGIDRTHPDLTGRVNTDSVNNTTPLTDGTGHETHVGAILAGSGSSTPGSFTNGSVSGTRFEGMARAAVLNPLSILPALAEPTFTAHAGGGSSNFFLSGVTVTYGSGGYNHLPSYFIFDSTPYSTNGSGAQETPGYGATLQVVTNLGQVSAINVLNQGTNYTATNTTIVLTEPWSEFQLITNQARHTNIYIVNNSWSVAFPEYDTTAATFDAAVRDSMPHWTGEQAVNYVFAAGNSGFGTTAGQGGLADSIESPATAKNVIAVGAIESLRNIPATTNLQTALEESDSDDQVASFSSRGNVGVGIEGEYGRFKPDLVAPGTWILSSRAATLHSSNLTSVDATINNSQLRYESGTSMAAPVVSGMLALMQEYFAANFSRTNSPALNKALLINGARPAGSQYDYAALNFINYQGWGVPALTNTLPAPSAFKVLASSTAEETAQVVAVDQSGLVTNRLQTGQYHHYKVTLSGDAKEHPLRITLLWTDPPGNPAAGVKLVNDLDLIVTNTANSNVFLGNFFPTGSDFTESAEPTSTNAIRSEFTRDFVNNVENVYLRGPFTNSSGSDVVLDVRISAESVNVNATEGDTNAIAQDYVLVISTEPGQTIKLKYETHSDPIATNQVVALYNGVPRTGQRVGANFPHAPDTFLGSSNQWRFYVFTNRVVPPFSSTNSTGTATNTTRPLTNVGPYVAFATFLPPNLARARNKEADIDIYVARSSDEPAAGSAAITNFSDPSVFFDPKTLRSTNRGGLELISLDDAQTAGVGEIFTIAVKSEDQQGGEFGFVALSSSEAFTGRDSDGVLRIPMFPVPMNIPDGSPSSPGGVTLFGIGLYSTNIVSVDFTNSIGHEAPGDLTAILTHNGTDVYLMNHNAEVRPGAVSNTNFPNFNRVYNSRLGTNVPSLNADGPGTMVDFLGMDPIGIWTYTVIDDQFNHTGAVFQAGLTLNDDAQNRNRNRSNDVTYITFDIDPGESFVDLINVPFTATNLSVHVQGAPNSDPGVELLVAYNNVPAAPFFTNSFVTNIGGTNYQVRVTNVNDDVFYLPDPPDLTNTFNSNITVHANSEIPLRPGLWFARVVNNTSSQLTLTLVMQLEHSFGSTFLNSVNEEVDREIPDMGATNLTLTAPFDGILADVSVSVGIDHPRPSDLVLHLISPSGKKVVLFENRGGLFATNLYANFTELTNLTTSIITDPAMGTMTHYTNLIPIKAITNQFTNVVSPPFLLTSNVLGLASSQSQPEAIQTSGGALFFSGSLYTNIGGQNTNWGMVGSYPLPMSSNTMSTNWVSIWPGPMNGPRFNRTDNTVFKDLVILPEGVFTVGVSNKDYFPVTPSANGFSNEFILDIDAGCRRGTLTFDFDSYTLLDHLHVYYEGSLLHTNSWPGIGTMGPSNISVNFGLGSDSFLRVAVNQGGNTNANTAWAINNISVTCQNAGPGSLQDVNQSVIIGYPSTGPVGGSSNVGTNGAIMISRGMTNNPYGYLGDDRLQAITSAAEDTTNMLYVVGSAQIANNGREKFFISKLDTQGRVIWTGTEEAAASATATHSAGSITSIDIVCPGTNYSTAPTVVIVDLHEQGSGASATASIGANGNVTAITVNNGGMGYQRPAVYLTKPGVSNPNNASSGMDVVVAYNTNVFAVGYSNSTSTVKPHIWAYDTNGCLLWASASTSSTDGPYYAAAIAGTNLYAVGAHDNGGSETASTIEKWDFQGNLILSTNYTHLSEVSGDPFDSFDDIIAFTCPERIYAIGTRTNASDSSTDAILAEIDPNNLQIISVTVMDKGSGNERGVGLSTDGRDLYTLVQTTPGGNRTSEIYRFRIGNYYQPEEDLHNFRGDNAWFFDGTTGYNTNWTLRVWDTRYGAGGSTNIPTVRCWGVDFTYAFVGTGFTLTDLSGGFTGTLLANQPRYFSFNVPVGSPSMSINLGVNQSVAVAVSRGQLPSFQSGQGSVILSQNADSGTLTFSTANGTPLAAGRYILGIKAAKLETGPTDFSLNLDFGGGGDIGTPVIIPLLENGILENGNISAGPGFSLYRFDVPPTASGARFELSGVGSDLNLYLRKDSSPDEDNYDFRSVTRGSGKETIFLIADGSVQSGLSPGVWYLGVQNNGSEPEDFGIKATSLTGQPYSIIPVTDGQNVTGTTYVGNAPNNMYKLVVGGQPKALLFEVTGLSGAGDLIIGNGQPPLRTTYTAGGFKPGTTPELTPVRTNASLPSLNGDWYFGVLNNGESNITYTAIAKQSSGGLLQRDTPLQLRSVPTASSLSGGDGTFGFGLDVVPGEKYQVQFAYGAHGPWFILTNIVAPQNAVIEFVHQNALTNRHLLYRVQQVE